MAIRHRAGRQKFGGKETRVHRPANCCTENNPIWLAPCTFSFFLCRALFSSLSVLFSSKSIFLFFIYFFRRTRIPEYSFSAFLFISLIKHIFQKKNTFLTKHSRNCPTCIRPRASYGSVQHIIKLFLASSSNVSQV